ncbi:MAG: ABC transporter ATP-binding protein [Dehalococcoidia bacterium]|nr:ABC transporter ATP-binding protein [Dehalococcoidia bacterium]
MSTQELTKDFGGVHAVRDVSLEVRSGEILGLIGPNGAGKTTYFKLISGFLRPTRGRILYRGREISGLQPNQVVKRGIATTFQIPALFPEMTVLQNVVMAGFLRSGISIWDSLLNTPSIRRKQQEMQRRASDVLEYLGIGDLANHVVSSLPYGHKKILGLGLALVTSPEMILLDEPFSGLSPVETEGMVALVRKLNGERQITILLIEHNLGAVMTLSHRIAVLNLGRLIALGTPQEIRQDKLVVDAYLGESDRAA